MVPMDAENEEGSIPPSPNSNNALEPRGRAPARRPINSCWTACGVVRTPILLESFMCAMLGRIGGRHRVKADPMRQPFPTWNPRLIAASRRLGLKLFLAALTLLSVRVSADSVTNSNTVVRFEIQRGTNALGAVDVELFDQEKPETVRNFLL